MENIVSFLLKSILSSLLLTAWYWIFLRNKKMHTYNRVYLLLSIVLSLCIPLFHFRWIDLSAPRYEAINKLVDNITGSSSWIIIFQIASALISSTLLIIFFSRIFHLYQIKLSHPNKKMNGFILVETELRQAPFSFLNNLFWRTDISFDDEMGKKIYQHELTHIRERHTYDKLFSQVIICVFWMNPFYWIIQKELNMVHEFIADEKSIKEGDAESFAYILLQSYDDGRYLSPAHSFFHSPIRRRLTMITTCSTASFSYLRRLSVLPVMFFVVMLCSFTIDRVQRNFSRKQGNEKKITAINTDQNEFFKKQRDERYAAEKNALNSNQIILKK